jgi:hypothetical protein
MAPRKPKEDKASAPVKGKVPDKAIKTRKQTQAKKEAPAKKKVSSASKAKTTAKPVEKKEVVAAQPVKKKEVAVPKPMEEPKMNRSTDKGPMLLGAGLLFMGLLLIAGRFLHIPFGSFLWPFIFIVPGAIVFLSAISSDRSSGEGLSILGGILTSLGVVFLMQSITGLWASWAYIWALVAPTSVGLSQMVYGNLKGRDSIADSGWKLTKIGLSIFAIGFLFFEVVLGISGFGLGRFGLPVFPMILILIGAIVLVRSIFRAK